jgi:hypothetical protein
MFMHTAIEQQDEVLGQFVGGRFAHRLPSDVHQRTRQRGGRTRSTEPCVVEIALTQTGEGE